MSGKFMNIKKMVIPIMTVAILSSQLAGCAVMHSSELLDMLNDGENIEIEVSSPKVYKIQEEKGKMATDINWIQLDQLKTYNKGFRQNFDKIFNINIITEQGINGKSGCLFVDEDNDRNGNTTIQDAFRNKAFNEKYWSNTKVKDEIIKIAERAYSDVKDNEHGSLMASLNAYYNLLPDNENPESFNPTQSVNREQFNAMVYRAITPVGKEYLLDYKGADDNYTIQTGGETSLTAMSKQMDKYNFLTASSKSIDSKNIRKPITRGEAIYTIVNSQFSEELQELEKNSKGLFGISKIKCSYTDVKNGGDIALKSGFRYKDKTTKEIKGKDRWQTFTLYKMLNSNDNELQEEMYNTMALASSLGLLGNGTQPDGEIASRWNEPLSREESIQLLVNTFTAQNKLHGYASDSEYGNINKDKFKISKSSEKAVEVDMENGLVYGKDETGNATVEDIKDIKPSDSLEEHVSKSIEEQFQEMQDELKQGTQSKPTTPTPPPAQQKPAEKPQQQQKQSGGVWTPPPGFVSPYASVTPEEQAEIDEALTNPGGGSGTTVTGNSDKLGTWG